MQTVYNVPGTRYQIKYDLPNLVSAILTINPKEGLRVLLFVPHIGLLHIPGCCYAHGSLQHSNGLVVEVFALQHSYCGGA